jgi:Spy/CpxP family protein refolding chaperone
MRSFPARLLTLGAALTIGALSAAAQPPAGGTARAPRAGQEQRPARNPAKGLLKDITLTDAQQTRVREVQQRFAEQRQQLMGDRQGRRPQGDRQARQRPDSGTRPTWRDEREAIRGKMQQLMERQAADLRAVLTPEQQPTFDRNLTAMKQRLATRGQGRGERGVRRGARADDRGAALDRRHDGRHTQHGGASGGR